MVNGLMSRATQPSATARILNSSLLLALMNIMGIMKPAFASCRANYAATPAQLNIDNEADRFAGHCSIEELLG